MFGSLVNKAETSAHQIARDAGLTLFVIILEFGAALFIVAGVAWSLAYVMPEPLALIVAGVALGLVGAAIFVLNRNGSPRAQEKLDSAPAASRHSAMPLLHSAAKTFDVAAVGLITREIQRRPLASLAAMAAVGAFLGAFSDSESDENED